jgi:hypothetical protein
MIDLIDLTLWNINGQHPILVNAPLQVLPSCRRPFGRPKQCDSVSLLNRKHDATRVNGNRAVGGFVECDDTKRFGCRQKSVRP